MNYIYILLLFIVRIYGESFLTSFSSCYVIFHHYSNRKRRNICISNRQWYSFNQLSEAFGYVYSIQYSSIQYNKLHNVTLQWYTVQCNTVQHNEIQYHISRNTTIYCTMQYNSMVHISIKYNPLQHNTMQYRAVQYGTIQ